MTAKMLLVKFHWDCGRMGSLRGLFVCPEAQLEALIGEELYFGEALGKHYEIYGTLEQKDVMVVSDDQEKIAWLQEIMGDTSTISGWNPLEYIRVNEDEDAEDEEEKDLN
jgi:hypothetical protein